LLFEPPWIKLPVRDGVHFDLGINELQESARHGDRVAEEQLFERLTARFRLFVRQRLGTASEAEEVVQEAVTTIFQKYREVDFESSFTGWAYQVLNNKIMTLVKTRERRRSKLDELSVTSEAAPAGRPDSDLEERLLDCLRALNRASPRHARILNLHYQGYTVEEICRRLGLTRTNFYSILSRARGRLQECLEKGGGL
jgi:RNA polymerase sigma-70 factor (ECF subfamily)